MNLNYKISTSLYPTWQNIARYIVFIGLIILLLTSVASASWYNQSLSYRVNLTVPSGARPYEINVTLSNATGTNVINASGTFLFCNGHCASGFDDIIFIDSVNNTPLPYTIINNTTGKTFINVSGDSIEWFYGNTTDLVPNSNGDQTFIQWRGASTGNYNLSGNLTTPGAYVWEARYRRTAAVRLYLASHT